jgi:hypothetical protein
MGTLAGLTGLLVGAVAAWQFGRARAAAELRRLQARLEERIRYWQDETERARATASRLTEQTAAWVAGCQQGREDVLSVARTLSQHGSQAGDDRVYREPAAPGR